MANKNQKVLSMALAALMAAGTITSAAPVANAAAKKPSAAAVKAATANYNAGVNKIAFAESYFAKYNMTSDSNVKYVQKYVDLAKTYLVKLPAGAQKNALTARINKMASKIAVQKNINTKFAQGLKYVNTGLGFDLTVEGNVDTAAKYLASANTYLNLLPEGQAKDILAQKVAKLDVNIATAKASQGDVKAAAEAAVAAYEKADLSTLENANKAADLKKAAVDAVAKLKAEDQAAFNTRIAAQDAKVADAIAKLSVVKVTAINPTATKTLKVTFNAPVADASKLTLKVTRDGVNVNVVETKWNDAKTEATLTTSYNMLAGKYTVTAKYDTQEESSASVEVKASQVAKATFTSSSAILVSGNAKKVTANVTFQNQYGEDLTKSVADGDVSITSSKGTAALLNGVITVTDTSDFTVDQKVVLTIVHKSTGTVASTTLTVAQTANVDSITLGDITTDDSTLKGKDIYVSSDLTKYYVPITVKDQYGNTLKAGDLTGLTILTSDATIVGKPTVATVNDQTVLSLVEAETNTYGTAVITVVSPSGKSASKTVVVKENAKVDTFTLQQPNTQLKQSTDAVLPFTVVDQYGNTLVKSSDLPVTDASGNPLAEGTYASTIKVAGTTISVVGGQIKAGTDYANNNARKLTVKPDANAKNVTINVITPTSKVQNLNLSVVDAPVPASIAKLPTSFKTAMQLTLNQDLKLADVSLKDQYGDSVDLSGNYTLSITPDDANAYVTANTSDPTKIAFNAAKKGTEGFTLELKNNGNTVDEYHFTVEAVDPEDITAYGIDDFSKLYTGKADSAHDISYTVYGLKGTTKVLVPQTIIKGASATEGIDASTVGTIKSVAIDTDGAEKTAKVNVIVEGTNGMTTITKDLKYSDASPVATKFQILDKDGNEITDAAKTVKIGDLLNVGSKATVSGTSFQFYVEDQYEVAIEDCTYVVTNVNDANVVAGSELDVKVSNTDGTVTLKNAAAGDSFTVTAMTKNGQIKTLKVFLAQ